MNNFNSDKTQFKALQVFRDATIASKKAAVAANLLFFDAFDVYMQQKHQNPANLRAIENCLITLQNALLNKKICDEALRLAEDSEAISEKAFSAMISRDEAIYTNYNKN